MCSETPEVVSSVTSKSQCGFVYIYVVNLKICIGHGVFPPVYLWFLLDCHCCLFSSLSLPDGLIFCAEMNGIGKLDVAFALTVSGFRSYHKLWKLSNRILEMPWKIIEGSYRKRAFHIVLRGCFHSGSCKKKVTDVNTECYSNPRGAQTASSG